MNTRKHPFVASMLVLANLATACAQAAPPTAIPATIAPQPIVAPTMAPAALDLKGTFDKYLAGLPDGFGGIAPAAVKDQMAATKVFVLDVREPADMAGGFIDGATNIPVRALMKNLDKLPAKDQPIIVTCASGHRGAFTMAALQMLGYTNVKSMSGGMAAWKVANLPVKTDGKPLDLVGGKAPVVDKDLQAAFDKWFSALPDGFGTIAPVAAKDQMAAIKTYTLDLREPGEIATTPAIDGAALAPVRAFLKTASLPADKTAPTIVICGSGHRSSISMMMLQMLGYTNVKSLAGGMTAWKAAIK